MLLHGWTSTADLTWHGVYGRLSEDFSVIAPTCGATSPRGTNRKPRYRGGPRNRLWWAHRDSAVDLQWLLTIELTERPDGTWTIA